MKSSIPAVAALVGLAAAQSNFTVAALPTIPTLTTIATTTATITSCPGGCTLTGLSPIPLPTRSVLPIGSNGTYTYAAGSASAAAASPISTSASTVSPSILPATGSADRLAVGGSLLMALMAGAAFL